MKELDYSEIEIVNGGIWYNVGRGIVGAASGMSAYSMAGGAAGDLNGCGFFGAGVGGFVGGATGWTGGGFTAGGAAYSLCQYFYD
ncbi:hypothetical protein IC617_11395 [Neiella sp. HB171785]|uniref:Bacteriocin n=1 Tax=Neiella litorisoli TaxID=2771431 RepID=A0A8J6QSM8_9GAMM|nr:hypothetical protein [Neiella litorisoli]MBD1390034.1 hypothetical protein [Neiella litorisoli]